MYISTVDIQPAITYLEDEIEEAMYTGIKIFIPDITFFQKSCGNIFY